MENEICSTVETINWRRFEGNIKFRKMFNSYLILIILNIRLLFYPIRFWVMDYNFGYLSKKSSFAKDRVTIPINYPLSLFNPIMLPEYITSCLPWRHVLFIISFVVTCINIIVVLLNKCSLPMNNVNSHRSRQSVCLPWWCGDSHITHACTPSSTGSARRPFRCNFSIK